MYKPTDRQLTFGSTQPHLSESMRGRLERSWAHGFHEKVYPLLLEVEDDFGCLYHGGDGRPNWSTARKLGLMVLQEMHDLDDQTLLDALSFDVRFQFALGLDPKDAYLSRRSYVDFRRRLAGSPLSEDLLRSLFVRIGDAAIAELGISTSKQRLDSTIITSNIMSRGRLELLKSTLRSFLLWLHKHHPQHMSVLSPELVAWHERDGAGWFGRYTKEVVRLKTLRFGGWLIEVVQVFSGEPEIDRSEAYSLCARVVSEQLEIDDEAQEIATIGLDIESTDETGDGDGDGDGGGLCIESGSPELSFDLVAKPAGDSMQSPYDPDVTCGHKGPGYLLQVAETCENSTTEVITDFDVTPCNEGDRSKAVPSLERLESNGRKPDTLFVDSGYIHGYSILEAQALGVDLMGPVIKSRLGDNYVGRDRFVFDEQTGHVITCPMGHKPARHGMRSSVYTKRTVLHAYFDVATCNECPLLGSCIVRRPHSGKKGRYQIDLEPNLRAKDEAHARQQSDDFWDAYAIRSGIEATMSELKRAHGLERLRVRRKTKVFIAAAFKVTACNVKRWLKAIPQLPVQDGQAARNLHSGREISPMRLLKGLLSQTVAAFRLWRNIAGIPMTFRQRTVSSELVVS